MGILKSYCSILHSKWANGNENTTIIGQWTEDDNEYIMVVPFQLRDKIVSLQNLLVERLADLEKMENDILDLQKEIQRLNEI